MAKQFSRFFVLIALAVFLLSTAGFAAKKTSTPVQRAQLRSKLKALSRQITAQRAKLREVKRTQRRLSDQLRDIEDRLEANKSRRDQVRLKMEMTHRQILIVTKHLRETEAKLAEHNRMLAQRLRIVYRHGPVSYASVLLSSKSFSDYVDRKYYISRVVNGDVSLVNEIKRETEEVRQDKATLERKQRSLRNLDSQLASQNQMIAEAATEKQDLLEKANNDREASEQELDELEHSSQEIENKIQALYATPAGKARVARPFVGGFMRPVSGRITSSFGYRVHPIFHTSRMHTGVDIGARWGTPIHAAASGVVIHAGWWGGYGNAIVIDHGGSISTLYGHCSSIAVRSGQSIKQGQVIGRVGSTGFSTGPHLHFEKRVNGRPVRPF